MKRRHTEIAWDLAFETARRRFSPHFAWVEYGKWARVRLMVEALKLKADNKREQDLTKAA